MTWLVHRQHMVVGEFSEEHRFRLDGEELVVTLEGQEVHRFGRGEWHTAGAVCGHDGTGVEDCAVCSLPGSEEEG